MLNVRTLAAFSSWGLTEFACILWLRASTDASASLMAVANSSFTCARTAVFAAEVTIDDAVDTQNVVADIFFFRPSLTETATASYRAAWSMTRGALGARPVP